MNTEFKDLLKRLKNIPDKSNRGRSPKLPTPLREIAPQQDYTEDIELIKSIVLKPKNNQAGA